MKSVVLLFILAATGLYAQTVSSPCPTGYTCTPIRVAPVVNPVPSSITYLPKFFASAGGGALIPGSGKFVYESISAYIGAQTYATTVQEFTLSKGNIQTCTLAGVSKPLYEFGPMSIGLTGLGGGCNSTSGVSGAAAATQGFISFRIRKTGMSIVLTGDKTFTPTGNQAAKITLGVAYGK